MSSIRKYAMIGLLAGLGFLSVGAVVTYSTSYEIETYYYSNAAHTTEVGWRIHMCNGVNHFEGRMTPYYERITTVCPNGS